MLPGPARILKCPFCGEKKKVLSLMSGNTFGAEYWSDNKQKAPMLPEVSLVQKCPNCGKYYIISRQKEEYDSEEDYSFETGYLQFPDMKEAFMQLSKEGFLDIKEEYAVRFMLHHAYNDYFNRGEAKGDATENDKSLFQTNGMWLIENAIPDDVMKAEYYREIGDFDNAIKVLNSITIEDDFRRNIASSVRERIEKKDSVVFKIE